MIEFGKTLRLARENKGLTIGQLAEITHLTPSMIEDLEKEHFEHISAPIYGRGFIKLFCNAVDLDAKPLVAEYMAIINGEHEPTIIARDVAAPTAESVSAPPAAEPQPAIEPQPTAGEPPAAEPPIPEAPFKLEHEIVASPKLPPETEPEPTPEPKPAFSRYAAPVRQAYETTISSSVWRIGVLSLAAIAILVLLAFGVRALYRATSSNSSVAERASAESPAAAPTPAQAATPAPAQAAAPRQNQKIPSLFID